MKIRLPERKRTRLKDFCYNNEGSYFITICAKDRKCIFGKITKKYIENSNPIALEQKIVVDADVELSAIGETVLEVIDSSRNAYENIIVENYVIMPNHLHLLLYVKHNDIESTFSNSLISNYVAALKQKVNRTYGYNVFQRSFFDHIVRGEKDFDNIYDYIDNNPVLWEKDCFYINLEHDF